jgi:hypothetical protein
LSSIHQSFFLLYRTNYKQRSPKLGVKEIYLPLSRQLFNQFNGVFVRRELWHKQRRSQSHRPGQ